MNILVRKIAHSFAKPATTVKNLKTTAVSSAEGLRVTFLNANNATATIPNPLEMFISSLAACETANLQALAKKKNFKLGQITWTRIESNYDFANWRIEAGPNNKIEEIFTEVEIETELDEAALAEMKELTEILCPVYQMIKASGIKIHSQWKGKPLK
jgi:uncharacterized OsmC-like protein